MLWCVWVGVCVGVCACVCLRGVGIRQIVRRVHSRTAGGEGDGGGAWRLCGRLSDMVRCGARVRD